MSSGNIEGHTKQASAEKKPKAESEKVINYNYGIDFWNYSIY